MIRLMLTATLALTLTAACSSTPIPANTSSGAPAAQAAAGDTAEISLEAKPWAVVTVDGERLGTTPVTQRLAAGPHTVVFTKGTQPTVTKEITVVAGADASYMADMGVTPAAANTSDAAPTVTATMTSATEMTVKFTARPWATVTVDGEQLGNTPLDKVLAPGEYTVTFAKGPATKVTKITVPEGGGTLAVSASFE
ncbi:MAG: diacylglycerol kinase family enzyme [Myxococcota bacterium]|jgi:diacylglycerol kinase family enzyme